MPVCCPGLTAIGTVQLFTVYIYIVHVPPFTVHILRMCNCLLYTFCAYALHFVHIQPFTVYIP